MIRRTLNAIVFSVCVVFVLPCPGQGVSSAPRPRFDDLLQAAQRARDANRDDEAIRDFRKALAERPESEEALWYLSTMLYEEAQYGESRDLLRRFLTLRTDAGPAWAMLGLDEFQLRQYSRALDHLQRAMTQGLGDRKELTQSVYFEIVVLLNRAERYDESIDMLQKMLAFGPPDPMYVEPAGLAGLRLPLLPGEIAPERRPLVELAGKSVLALLTERYEDADSNFKQLVTAYPAEPGVHFLYGAFLEQLHPDQSAAEFRRELEVSPSNVLARIRLANQLIVQREFADALILCNEVLKLDPKRASAHMLAGEALLATSKSVDGLKELETAREIDRDEVRTHWDLLRGYAAAGRVADANREKQAIESLNDAHQQNRSVIAADKLNGPTAP